MQRQPICDGCCYGKQSRRPFGTRKQRATTPGELVNIDVCGPMQQQSLGGAKYYVCFKDDFTNTVGYGIVKIRFNTRADVEKEMEEISCNAEDTEETLVQQSSRNLRDSPY
ncbi:hypothetical protein TNCT_211031 [Trichonephila clavata]|uniref:Uncharacterized protein n=1 Tax=Trichonephila clavata TaxID=2740835 RepID=A0A8X6JGH5_TRICU|nr:hypothetical protein TNCT_211031 [Trichonephila clavata]